MGCGWKSKDTHTYKMHHPEGIFSSGGKRKIVRVDGKMDETRHMEEKQLEVARRETLAEVIFPSTK